MAGGKEKKLVINGKNYLQTGHWPSPEIDYYTKKLLKIILKLCIVHILLYLVNYLFTCLRYPL